MNREPNQSERSQTKTEPNRFGLDVFFLNRAKSNPKTIICKEKPEPSKVVRFELDRFGSIFWFNSLFSRFYSPPVAKLGTFEWGGGI